MKQKICQLYRKINALMAMIPEWLLLLMTRLLIFRIFWLSVQTKIFGLTLFGQHFAFWSLGDNVFFQFWEYPAPLDHNIMIYAGTFAEFFLPLLLLFGLFTRFAALGLLVVTAVIQIVEPQAWWTVHVFWVLILLYLVKHGGGKASIDHLLCKK